MQHSPGEAKLQSQRRGRWEAILPMIVIMVLFSQIAFSHIAEARADKADLVLLDGNIVTMDQARPRARAVAARGDRIVAVGASDQIRRLIGPHTTIIELDGKTVIPAFIEGHGHFVGLGRSKMVLDLRGAENWLQIVELVERAAGTIPAGHWVVGRGWHQSKWNRLPEPNVDGYPVHDALSRAAPDHPVLLTHASGHMILTNAKAMESAGVDRNTACPEGGEILRDSTGDPIGAFREEAAGLIHQARSRDLKRLTARQEQEEFDEAIRLATAECLANGVTSFHDAGSSLETIDRFRRLAGVGELGVRLWVMIGESNHSLERRLSEYRMVGFGNHHLTVRAIKRFIDGALGTHGAWLLEPYCDTPDSVGLNTDPIDSLRETARLAAKHDFQLCIHAIGDRANRETLDLYEATFEEHAEKSDFRWRIEHAQHLHPADVPRFSKLGVIAAMQGCHATSDGPFVVQRLGTRRAGEGAYAWRSLLNEGTLIVNGSDTPVEPLSPIMSFHASVTRKLPDGTLFFPEQRMTRQQALKSYTLAPAYSAFEEDLKGSITPGKLADLIVLSRNILTIPEEEIPGTRVLRTILGGKVVFRAESDGLPQSPAPPDVPATR